jgi:hypothetical protein
LISFYYKLQFQTRVNGGCQNGTLGNHYILGFLSLGFPGILATLVLRLSLVEL